jgi:ankyrin repeat protein
MKTSPKKPKIHSPKKSQTYSILTSISEGSETSVQEDGSNPGYWGFLKDSTSSSNEFQRLSYYIDAERYVLLEEELQKDKDIINQAVDKKGNTLLHYAVRYGKIAAVRLLLKNGALCTMSNLALETPEDITHDSAIKNLFLKAQGLPLSDSPTKAEIFTPSVKASHVAAISWTKKNVANIPKEWDEPDNALSDDERAAPHSTKISHQKQGKHRRSHFIQ